MFGPIAVLSRKVGKRVRVHPTPLGESRWVWVGAGSRAAGSRTGRVSKDLRRTRSCRSAGRRKGWVKGASPETCDNDKVAPKAVVSPTVVKRLQTIFTDRQQKDRSTDLGRCCQQRPLSTVDR